MIVAHRFLLLIAFTLLLPFSAVAQATTQAAAPAELPNFHQVSDRLYRGAQPQESGIKKLREMGIETIINLREDSRRVQREKAAAEALGIRYINLPWPSWHGPLDSQVSEVRNILDNPRMGKTFVHCRRGADRTGTVFALYRIYHDGWDADRALAEAKQLGMRWTQVPKRSYIRKFYEQRQATADKSTGK
ncbi:MAG: fused DSP-PTPase phosphatase/NAD kinase-like protein [Blastocatellia bacterium]